MGDNTNKGAGLRFNDGKTRHDLIPPFAQEMYGKVLTKGAEKYEVRNWERGMDWSKVTASLDRHILKFKAGEDFDEETGLHHLAHAMCNCAFLLEYYKIYPQGDDRPQNYLNTPKIALDVDNVLADWSGHYSRHFGLPMPEHWTFDRDWEQKFKEITKMEDWWMDIPVLTHAKDIHFEPDCYVTARAVPTDWTEKWLDKNGFTQAPVITVSGHDQKLDTLKERGIEIFVDDRHETMAQLTNAGIFTYLFDAPHNQRYEVGHRRIKSLSDIPFYKNVFD